MDMNNEGYPPQEPVDPQSGSEPLSALGQDSPDPPGKRAPYERLERLEVRLQPSQVQRLESMSRRLTRERRSNRPAPANAPRLNKSALIRAAIVVLTEARGAIHGTTEAEIADSLKRCLANPDTATPPTLPPATRNALRQARHHTATLTQLLDEAETPGGTGTID